MTWEITKRNGVFGLYIRDYPAPGLPAEWYCIKPMPFDQGLWLLETGLAHGDPKDIARWKEEAERTDD